MEFWQTTDPLKLDFSDPVKYAYNQEWAFEFWALLVTIKDPLTLS